MPLLVSTKDWGSVFIQEDINSREYQSWLEGDGKPGLTRIVAGHSSWKWSTVATMDSGGQPPGVRAV